MRAARRLGVLPAIAVRVSSAHPLPRSFVVLIGLLAAAAKVTAAPPAEEFVESVVKVRAVAADGSQSLGSGVVIASNLLITACHVTRGAKSIEITHRAEHWNGKIEAGSVAHDLCLISVQNLGLPAVAIRRSESLRRGERVIAAGFPGGRNLIVNDGAVEGLYQYDGGNVIRTSAVFDTGSSGGGLFDEEGVLVGVLAFKARSGTNLHFALPADWALPGTIVSSHFGKVVEPSKSVAFWEGPRASQPAFLGHALLEAASQRR